MRTKDVKTHYVHRYRSVYSFQKKCHPTVLQAQTYIRTYPSPIERSKQQKVVTESMWRVSKEAIMSIYYDDKGLGGPFIIICHDRSSLFLAVSEY